MHRFLREKEKMGRTFHDRMAFAIDRAYELSESQAYSALDAVYVVGDFANSGSPAQMAAFRKTLDEHIKPGTVWNVSLASHEFGFDGEEVNWTATLV